MSSEKGRAGEPLLPAKILRCKCLDTTGEKASPAHLRCVESTCQISPLNVSQDASFPVSKPRLNHLARWAEVPWVKLSGTT